MLQWTHALITPPITPPRYNLLPYINDSCIDPIIWFDLEYPQRVYHILQKKRGIEPSPLHGVTEFTPSYIHRSYTTNTRIWTTHVLLTLIGKQISDQAPLSTVLLACTLDLPWQYASPLLQLKGMHHQTQWRPDVSIAPTWQDWRWLVDPSAFVHHLTLLHTNPWECRLILAHIPAFRKRYIGVFKLFFRTHMSAVCDQWSLPIAHKKGRHLGVASLAVLDGPMSNICS